MKFFKYFLILSVIISACKKDGDKEPEVNLPKDYGSGIPIINTTSYSSFPSGQMTVQLEESSSVSNKYTYIVYPESYGDLSSITLNDATPVLSAFHKLGGANGIAHTRYDVEVDYQVYRSTLKGAYEVEDTLTIKD